MQVSLHRDRREWVRRYHGLGGVKFGQSPMYAGEAGRFAYLENLYRDHENGYGAALETIPGFRAIFLDEHPIYGIYFYNSVLAENGKEMLIHAGDTLWRYGSQNLLRLQPEVSVMRAGVQCHLAQSGLSVHGGPTADLCVPLLSELALSRGGYTFAVKNLKEDASTEGISLCLRLSDGRAYIVGAGETCAFSVEEQQVLQMDIRLYSPSTAFSYELELQLNSTTVGSIPIYRGLRHQKSCAFQMGERFYLLDGARLLCYDGERVADAWEDSATDVLWQDQSGKRIRRQRNMLDSGFYNYFHMEPICTDNADLRLLLSDPAARVYLVEYLTTDGEWKMYPAQYTKQGGCVVLDAFYNADRNVYEVPLPEDMERFHSYNLRVCCANAQDATVSAQGREAFSVRHAGVSLQAAITRCTMACVHDDRVFLSGNPDCPGCVFYSARNNPGFFGTFDYFEDGGGASRVTGLTASGDTLLVCLAGDGKESAAFYHTRISISDDIQEEIYAGTPVAYNLFTTGPCLNFAGELTFLACDGLYGISRRNDFGERAVWHRSDSVDARLHRTDHAEAAACVWRGYLWLLCADGSLYLADSKQTYKNKQNVLQYEWYYVSNVGVYRGQQYHTGEDTPTLACGEAYGGNFLPGRILVADEQTVYFGCEDGTVCAFWFDQRGVSGEFAPAHYTQNGRRYPSVLLTARDDGEVPHLRKRTVPHSTIVRTGVHSNLQARVYVRTDRAGTRPLSELRAQGLDFNDLHFEGLSFSALDHNLFALAERAEGWMEKQYLFVCDRFLGKFSLAELSYSYRLCGRYRATDSREQ